MIHAAATQATQDALPIKEGREISVPALDGFTRVVLQGRACISRERREKCLSRSVLKNFDCDGI